MHFSYIAELNVCKINKEYPGSGMMLPEEWLEGSRDTSFPCGMLQPLLQTFDQVLFSSQCMQLDTVRALSQAFSVL